MAKSLPAISGQQLIRLLERDGWEVVRQANHGLSLAKIGPDGRKRVTVVPNKRGSLPNGTLRAILGPLQTGIGFDGLAALIERYGIK